MNKILSRGAVTAAALAGAFVLLTGFHGGCGHRPHQPDPARMQKMVSAHVDDVLDDLDATPDQRQKIHALVDGVLAEGAPLMQARRADHAELIAQWDADHVDAAKVHALIDQRIDALRAFAHKAADAAIQAHDTLTPAQRAKVSKRLHRHLDE